MKSDENKDSLFNLSLNGAEGKFGFLDIIDNFSDTDASNLSYYSLSPNDARISLNQLVIIK